MPQWAFLKLAINNFMQTGDAILIKLRLRFSKTGPLRFIGHLDLLKVFQQTIRRAGLPMAYSQGFNPHMLLSFALPLPLGMTGCNDYADITLENRMPPADIVSRFNANAPTGLHLKDVWEFEGPGAAALVSAADYLLKLPTDAKRDDIIVTVQALLNRETIVIPKKTKSGIKDTDIRSDIFDITVGDTDILLRLAAGSGRFLNPLIVAKLILGHDVPPSLMIRQELYSDLQKKPIGALAYESEG